MAGERATKMLIISSARTLFSEKGYEETPVEEICMLAGVAKGTFFYHFESKQYIVRHILAMQLQENRDRLLQQLDTLRDAMSKVEYFLSILIEQNESNFETQQYFKNGEPEWFAAIMDEERMNALLPLFEEIVLEGIREGFFSVKNPGVCTKIAFLGIDAYLHKTLESDGHTRKGIKEIAAKTLGIKETALAI